MIRRHICWTIFLVLLMIAPELPLNWLGLPTKSTLSLGFIGLIVWAIVCPSDFFSFLKIRKRATLHYLMIAFVVYAFIVSVLSLNKISLLYALQYLFYGLIGGSLIRQYVARCYRTKDLKAVGRITTSVGIIYAMGVLLSLFVGPIYKEQAGWTQRLVGETFIQRGTGFAENPNHAGGILLFFTATALFLYPSKRATWFVFGIVVLGLIATFSRSAIVAGAVAYISLASLWVLRAFFVGRISKMVVSMAGLIGMSAVIVVVVIVSFGGAFGQWSEDLGTRLEIWTQGLEHWAQQGFVNMLVGVGFYGSFEISSFGTWRTSHNFYIAVLNDFGIIGTLLVISIIAGSLFAVGRKLLVYGEMINIYSLVWVVLVGTYVHNMTEIFLYSVRYLVIIMFCIALLEEQVRHETPNRDSCQ